MVVCLWVGSVMDCSGCPPSSALFPKVLPIHKTTLSCSDSPAMAAYEAAGACEDVYVWAHDCLQSFRVVWQVAALPGLCLPLAISVRLCMHNQCSSERICEGEKNPPLLSAQQHGDADQTCRKCSCLTSPIRKGKLSGGKCRSRWKYMFDFENCSPNLRLDD